MVRVKVCGITNESDAFMAVEMGADALGFIFARSPRTIGPEEARRIICALPPFAQTVGVFVNENPGRIREITAFCDLDLIQLHGDESPELCETLMPRCLKAIRVRSKSSLDQIRSFEGKVRAVVLDSYSDEIRGGTGNTFDWGLAAEAKKTGIPIILAGGLDPDNIEEAILTVKPFAVDINSGIEQSAGKKNHFLMGELMERIGKISKEGTIHDS
jgi:phosphoribosylanthranilate isomerase